MKISRYQVGNQGLKIALITDFHNKPYNDIITTVRSIQPDIIAVAGDLTYGFKQYDRVAGFLNACGNIAPTFVSPGNHDIGEIIEPKCSLAQGITLLDNCYAIWTQW